MLVNKIGGSGQSVEDSHEFFENLSGRQEIMSSKNDLSKFKPVINLSKVSSSFVEMVVDNVCLQYD